MDLSTKQLAFIDEYLIDRNGAQAAIRAGYSASCARQTASRLLAHADIRSAIDRRLEDLSERHRIDRETVLQGLLRAIQIADEDRNPSAVVRGWAEINKMLGYHEPVRAEVNLSLGQDRYQKHIESLSTEELLEMAGGSMRDE
jgi:phage terminase small subunit